MRILLTGASGLIGTEIARRAADAHEVRRLVRREPGDGEYRWNPAAGILPAEAVEWADAVISLSGASLARLPWTKRYRTEILRSRTDATGTIAMAIAAASAPPKAWVSASAVGIYGNRTGETLTEEDGRGSGFLADVVAAWEGATTSAAGSTRIVHARTGLVLARGGALRPLMWATQAGLGATVGTGQQHWPWISLADEAEAMLHLATRSRLSGAVNLVGPTPATSKEVTTSLARAMHRPHLLQLPAFALRAGMGLAADELLLADQRVEALRLGTDGFQWRHRSADEAIAAAI